jgi:hypothetical protein
MYSLVQFHQLFCADGIKEGRHRRPRTLSMNFLTCLSAGFVSPPAPLAGDRRWHGGDRSTKGHHDATECAPSALQVSWDGVASVDQCVQQDVQGTDHVPGPTVRHLAHPTIHMYLSMPPWPRPACVRWHMVHAVYVVCVETTTTRTGVGTPLRMGAWDCGGRSIERGQ